MKIITKIHKRIPIPGIVLIVGALFITGCINSSNKNSIANMNDNTKESLSHKIVVTNNITDNTPNPSKNEAKVITEKTSEAEDMNTLTGEISVNNELSEQFYIREIDDELFTRIKGKSYKDNCTVPVNELRYLHILNKDLEGNTHEGEIICNAYIAQDLLEIFEELFENSYPIEKVHLIDEYDADDEQSMADNNSSSFNFRYISHTTTISKHGLGMAVDINPLYNPYVKTVNGRLNIEPANGAEYVDRTIDFPYKIDTEDLAYRVFTEHGFEWGGNWSNSKDYQHFEVPDSIVNEIYSNQ